MRRHGSLKLGAKTSLYVLSAAGLAAAATYGSDDSGNAINFFPSFLNGVVRSSRALFTITSCVVDYKYSLHGLPADSEEYGCTLSEIHLRSAIRIQNLCDTNKGFYVKAGQFVAAARQVPKEYSSTLSSLQDQAVPCNFEAVKEVIVKSLGKDLSEIFLSFDEKPVAAASIAQVHRAILKEHQEVAVKVQYPGLEYQMKFDLATMALLSRSVAWIDDLEYMKRMGISPLEVAKSLIDVFAEMIFVHGFLHGDPHPGNILVSPEGPNEFALVILDHGIYKQLPEEFRKNYCHLWEALIRLDSQKILQLGETFGVGKYARYFPVIFTGRTISSKSVLGRGMSPEEKKHLKEELKSLKMEDVSSFMESLPPDFVTILRTDGLLRSIISKLGAPQRIRLLTYAKCALRGLSTEASSESVSAGYGASRLKASIKYIQLRIILGIMELVISMDEIGWSLRTKLRQLMLSARDQIWRFNPYLSSAT